MSADAEIEPVIGDFDGILAALAFLARKTQGSRLICEEAAGETMGLDDDPVVGVVAADDKMRGDLLSRDFRKR